MLVLGLLHTPAAPCSNKYTVEEARRRWREGTEEKEKFRQRKNEAMDEGKGRLEEKFPGLGHKPFEDMSERLEMGGGKG